MSEPQAVSIMKSVGDPDELLAIKREQMDPFMGEIARDGLMAINLWEREEGRHSMAEEVRSDRELRRRMQESGMREPEVTGYEVVQHVSA